MRNPDPADHHSNRPLTVKPPHMGLVQERLHTAHNQIAYRGTTATITAADNNLGKDCETDENQAEKGHGSGNMQGG